LWTDVAADGCAIKSVSVEAEDKVAKFLELTMSHPANMSGFLVQFSATTWEATIANSGGIVQAAKT
jgi:hypothetical protein